MNITGIHHLISDNIAADYDISIDHIWDGDIYSYSVYVNFNTNRYTDGYIYFGSQPTMMQAIESAMKACEYNTKTYQQIEEDHKHLTIMND